jgi:hypothetical protein
MSDARTFEAIEELDLQEILGFGEQELQRFLEHAGTPAGKYRCYSDRIFVVCLVQGVALFVVYRVPLNTM